MRSRLEKAEQSDAMNVVAASDMKISMDQMTRELLAARQALALAKGADSNARLAEERERHATRALERARAEAKKAADAQREAAELKLAKLLAEQREMLDEALRKVRHEYETKLSVAEETAAAAHRQMAAVLERDGAGGSLPLYLRQAASQKEIVGTEGHAPELRIEERIKRRQASRLAAAAAEDALAAEAQRREVDRRKNLSMRSLAGSPTMALLKAARSGSGRPGAGSRPGSRAASPEAERNGPRAGSPTAGSPSTVLGPGGPRANGPSKPVTPPAHVGHGGTTGQQVVQASSLFGEDDGSPKAARRAPTRVVAGP